MLYLLAGNGAPNFGDELLVLYWLRYYREAGYDGPITVDGKGHEATARLLKEFDNVHFVSRIPRHSQNEGSSYSDFYRLGTQYAESTVVEFDKVTGFHFLGGGYTSANWVNATRLLSTVVRLGQLLDVPVVATGMGISPFKSMDQHDKLAWKNIIQGFDFFECRDEQSINDLQTIVGNSCSMLVAGLDDAFLYPVNTKSHTGRWLHLSGFTEASVTGQSPQITRDFFQEFDQVTFWTCSHKDNLVYKTLLEQFPNIIRWSNHMLLNMGLPVQQGDFMITGRFHPHLLAARCGATGYYSTNSRFYDAKHGMVLALGSPFKPLIASPRLFTTNDDQIILSDYLRVAEKRKVADKVAKILCIHNTAAL
ncbi:polysaccharide pyruvyl transferase family protein [Alkanindiges illinoisensis]|uniref:polysaccharide pyruvyl transferase family protein n=1 Tax=Alkanindiges illinoisensis TaxID=197183 RepID=UPI00047998B5|nr:polysaccharide pyruvyl transferase family protein [Alkanindiges illinoisensis]